jgi:hypothetical protein
MPDTIRERCVQALIARLEAITGFPGLSVLRQPDQEIESYPALALFEGDQTEDDSFSQVIMKDLEIKLEAWVETASTTLARQTLEQIGAAIEQSFDADPTLGGLAFDLVRSGEQTEMAADGSRAIGTALISYVLRYQTRRGDPFTAA